MKRWVNWGLALLLAATGWAAETREQPAEREAWLQVVQLNLRGAHEQFAALAAAQSDPRAAALGEAMTLRVIPPGTDGQFAQARRDLRSLAKKHPTDEAGLAARYLLGRFRQVHDRTAEPDVDAPELVELARDHAETFWGQLAMLKLTLHRLYRPSAEFLWAQRLQSVAGFEARLREPALLREYHLTVGRACIYFDRDLPLGLRHLEQALALGVDDTKLRADLLVQTGELARMSQRPEVAARYYRMFLAENPEEGRTLIVQDRLRALERTGP